ncbi:hypothetical protein BerOc1_01165 [Pseudodesulfovibrio hydrargyri]|uniref:Uncharacterized protein n=1 Tax=Pseudodesulfovibrio hydrargyri TaxID=2125990 RepID=A0A1J5NBX7_9BACT|nr:hypothetical protein [Pseudodesulfovibrio hydrargyri]OIQ49241.1 hypothetical protein BerOc1_01165 [Pseudodesulfovibrio hydrargyri]
MSFLARENGAITISIFGINIKFTNHLGIEHNDAGPYAIWDLVKSHAEVPFFTKGINVQHGWFPFKIYPGDIERSKSLMLVWNKRYKDNWHNFSDVPCEIVGAPFVHYRRDNNITIAPEAQGTVAFPAHSCDSIKAEYNISQYCDELSSLPSELKPITVCLHPKDIRNYHLDEVYRSHGFQVVCAALTPDKLFHEAFYDILSKHRFATSNGIGTHVFYAVEMGIPFFISGNPPEYVDHGGVYSENDDDRLHPTEQHAYELFRNQPLGVITEEQREYVLSEMGVNDCLSQEELNLVIRRAALKEYDALSPAAKLGRFCKLCLRHPLRVGELLRYQRFVSESRKMLLEKGAA